MRGVLVLLALLGTSASRAETVAGDDEARARQLARLLELEPQLDIIVQSGPPATQEEAIGRLRIVQHAIVELSRASLTLEATRGRLLREGFQVKNAYDSLETHYESSLTRWNIAGDLVGNSVAIIGAGMTFGNETVADAGLGITIAGATVAAAFSLVALLKHDRGPLPFSIDTNMLAPLLGRPATDRSRYADWIWRYFDTPQPGKDVSIHQELLDKWTHEGRLPRGPGDQRRLDMLTRPLRAAQRVDGPAIDDRADMLADVRERLASLSGDLELLLRQFDTEH